MIRWARPYYLAAIPSPQSSPDRYYYESWLGTFSRIVNADEQIVRGCNASLNLMYCQVGVCGGEKWATWVLRRSSLRLNRKPNISKHNKKRS